MIGKVKWYDGEKGYGFIATESGQDVFLHYSALAADGSSISIKEGVTIEFEVESTRNGPAAKNVKILVSSSE